MSYKFVGARVVLALAPIRISQGRVQVFVNVICNVIFNYKFI